MSISLEPNKGLRLKIGRFSAIRTWHGGGNFWSHEFQLTVRSGALAGFLPRALEEDDSVLFEYRGGGGEQACASVAIKDMAEIPNKQLKALREAVEELKRKAEDPHCDRTKRQMIQGFRLPDPQKDLELYRLIGKGSSAKLIVLWGLEREEGSALAPSAAVDLMHTPTQAEELDQEIQKRRGLPVLPLFLGLGVVAFGAWYFWQQDQQKKTAMAAAEEAERIAAFNQQAASGQAVVGEANGMPSAPASPAQGDAEKVIGSTAQEGKSQMVEPKSEPGATPTQASADPGKKGAATQDAKGKADLSSKPLDAMAKAKSYPALASKPDGALMRDSEGKVTGVKSAAGVVTPLPAGASIDRDGKLTSTSPGTLVRDRAGAVAGIMDGSGKVVAADPNKVIVAEEGKPVVAPVGTLVKRSSGVCAGVVGPGGRVIPALPGTVLDEKSRVVGGAPGTVYRSSTGHVSGIVGKDGRLVDVDTNQLPIDATSALQGEGTAKPPPSEPAAAPPKTPTVAPAGTTPESSPSSVTTTPMTTQGPPPAGISSLSIVSTSLSGVLADGSVEVLLNVVARDLDGTVVAAPTIMGWKVNEKTMLKPDGQTAGGSVLPLSLPPGVHQISTAGVGADGKPFQTDAAVTVTPKQ